MIHPAHITQKVRLSIFKVFVLIPSYSPGDWGGTRNVQSVVFSTFKLF